MKDKKDGKNRTSYTNGCNMNLNSSPLASSTTEKDDLNLRSYHHNHHNYYQPVPMPVTFSAPPPPSSFQTQHEYTSTQAADLYEMTTNYSLKQSNYYNHGNNLKGNYHTSFPAASYDNYYFNAENSTMHHQQTGTMLPPFV